MLQLRGGSFTKIVTALLIAQLLLLALSTRSGSSAVINKRATTAINDPDIVGHNAAEAADVRAPKAESENVTKLLPQAIGDSDGGGSIKQETALRSSGSMLLHRVVEKSSAESAENESIASRSKNSLELPQISAVTAAPEVHTAGLFSEAAHNKVSHSVDGNNNVNDGLDSSALELEYTQDSLDEDRAQEMYSNVRLTTEGILPEIEEIVPHTVKNNGRTVVSAIERASLKEVTSAKLKQSGAVLTTSANELGDEIAPTARSVAQLEAVTEMPHMADTNREYSNANATLEHDEAANNYTTLPHFIMSTPGEAAPTSNNTDNMPITTIVPIQLAATKATKVLHSSSFEDSNEIRASAGSSEKRAKFISDNATNAQQLHLPDAAEVWTLAGMKAVPKANVAMTTPLMTEERQTAEKEEQQQLDHTEQPINGSSNSEKNLFDWTQIMMSGELDSKKYDNFLDQTTKTQRNGESHAVDLATRSTAPEKIKEPFENRTEALFHATGDATDETTEPVIRETDATANSTTTTKATLERTAVNDYSASSQQPRDHANEIHMESTTSTEQWLRLRPDLLQPNTSTVAPATADDTPQMTAHNTATHLVAAAAAATAAMATSTEAILSETADKRDNSAISNASATTSIETEAAERGEQGAAAVAAVQSTEMSEATLAATASTATLEYAPLPVITTTTSSNLPTTSATATITTTPPPPALSHTPAPKVTLQANNNYEDEHDGSAANASATVVHDATQVALSSSATTTVSTLAAGEVTASTITNVSSAVELTSARDETDLVLDITDTTTSTPPHTILPDILVTTTSTETTTFSNIPLQPITSATTTEIAGQIGNEVDLVDVRRELEQNLATSSNKTHLAVANETAAAAETTESTTEVTTTTTLAINELLIPKNNTAEDATLAVTKTEAETTLKPVVESTTTTTTTTTTTVTPTTGSTAPPPVLLHETDEEETTTTTTATASSTQATPVAVKVSPTTTLAKPTAIVKGQVSHESQASIETNDIDPLDKQTTTSSSTNATEQPTDDTDLPLKEHQANTLGEEVQPNNEHILLQEDTTTMGTLALNSTTTTPTTTSYITTTTEPPLISLLDDSTTTTTTTTTIPSISTNNEDIYSVYSSTESVPTKTATVNSISSTTATPTTLLTTTITNLDVQSTTALPTEIVISTAVPTITTMLPPLQASIAGSDSAAPVSNMPGMPVMPSGNLQPNSANASETDVNVIIAISVSVIGVVALILLVAFLYLMRKRQKQMSYGQRCRPVSLDAYSLDNVSVLGSVRRKGALRASKRSYGNVAFDDPSLRHNVLTAAELARFVERRSSIFEEFRDVPQIHARADEVPPGCEDKNRYANVIPLPETRVVLQQQSDDEKTEYINANYIRGPKDTPNYYIACQAPLESTAPDFWRMIWEQQSRVIIQATDLIENGIEKCADYLPPSVTLDNHTTYGDFQVTLKNREVKDRYAISTAMLKNTVEDCSRELTHYWYKWPEAGVPSEDAPIIAMLLEARSSLKSYAVEQTNELKEKSSTLTLKADDVSVVQVTPVNTSTDEAPKGPISVSVPSSNGEINGNVSTEKLKAVAKNQGPLTVHCSPGTGRTGTIIACDMAIRSLETPKRSVDIPQIVYYVRRGRASAVQTKEQYEFIYKVANIKEGLREGLRISSKAPLVM